MVGRATERMREIKSAYKSSNIRDDVMGWATERMREIKSAYKSSNTHKLAQKIFVLYTQCALIS